MCNLGLYLLLYLTWSWIFIILVENDGGKGKEILYYGRSLDWMRNNSRDI